MSTAGNRADGAAHTRAIPQDWGRIQAPLESLPAGARPLPVSGSGSLVQKRSHFQQHVSGVGHSSITEQWLCCGRKRPDQHGPAGRRAPFPKQWGASSPACLLRRVYSVGQVLCPGPPCCLRVPAAARGCKRPSSACLQPRHCGDPTLCLVRARRPRAGGVAQRERLRLEGAPQPL